MSLTEQDNENIINFKEIVIEHNMDSIYSQLAFYIATNVVKRLEKEYSYSSSTSSSTSSSNKQDADNADNADNVASSTTGTNDIVDTHVISYPNDIESIDELDNKLYIPPESLIEIKLTINQNAKKEKSRK